MNDDERNLISLAETIRNYKISKGMKVEPRNYGEVFSKNIIDKFKELEYPRKNEIDVRLNRISDICNGLKEQLELPTDQVNTIITLITDILYIIADYLKTKSSFSSYVYQCYIDIKDTQFTSEIITELIEKISSSGADQSERRQITLYLNELRASLATINPGEAGSKFYNEILRPMLEDKKDYDLELENLDENTDTFVYTGESLRKAA